MQSPALLTLLSSPSTRTHHALETFTIFAADGVMPLPCLPLVASSKALHPQMMLALSDPPSKDLIKATVMILPRPLLPRLEEAETIQPMHIKQAKTISWPTQDP